MVAKKDIAAFSLISEYQKRYREKYGVTPEINKFKEKWAAQDLLDSFGLDRCVIALDTQFDCEVPHTWIYFARNCDKLLEHVDAVEKDLEERRRARELAKAWLSE